MTQIELARDAGVSPEMKRVAADESLDVKLLAQRIRDGLVVIPANKNHKLTQPIGIGTGLRTKVNANIGTSPARCSLDEELEKLRGALDAGADTIMDLSIGDDIDAVRRAVIEACPVPLGTVPIYQAAIEAGAPESATARGYLDVFEKHARDGVDFATVHAGVTRGAIPLLEKRLMGVVSRGGAFLIKWMQTHDKESFLYECFDEVLAIAREHDVTLSLGDGLRPGCLEDATDEAQLHELKVLGELAERCRKSGVQVMIEGPGHIPLNDIVRNVELEKKHCHGAPFYVLGPLPTDAAPGYDHIVGAIGGALAAYAGADFLCYLTPKEHIGLPGAEDVRAGVMVTRVAAHIGDVAKGITGARDLDRRMAEARTERDWEAMAKCALDPELFARLLDGEEKSDQCSMCGKYCALKVFRDALGR